MKLRNFSFFIKEGISNILANKWMSIASAFIIFATLFIFGSFFLFALNIENISDKIEDQPMHAFTIEKADLKMAQNAKEKISKIDGVKSVKFVAKDEGLDELKSKLISHEILLDGINADFLPYKIIIHVDNPQIAEEVKTSVEAIPEIDYVNYAKDTMQKVLQITKIFRILSIFLIVVLGLISLFIIVYTIKLTVFSRRKEINIMKYVGATDWFIKWPFVIEGIAIGIFGSILAVIFVFACYGYVYSVFTKLSISIFELIPLDRTLRNKVFWIFMFLGISIGSIGSSISVKKYLDV